MASAPLLYAAPWRGFSLTDEGDAFYFIHAVIVPLVRAAKCVVREVPDCGEAGIAMLVDVLIKIAKQPRPGGRPEPAPCVALACARAETLHLMREAAEAQLASAARYYAPAVISSQTAHKTLTVWTFSDRRVVVLVLVDVLGNTLRYKTLDYATVALLAGPLPPDSLALWRSLTPRSSGAGE